MDSTRSLQSLRGVISVSSARVRGVPGGRNSTVIRKNDIRPDQPSQRCVVASRARINQLRYGKGKRPLETTERDYRRDGVSFVKLFLTLPATCSRDVVLTHFIIWSWNSGRNRNGEGKGWSHRKCGDTYAPTCSHSVVCSVARFPHQLYGILGTRFDSAFERVWIPGVMSQSSQHLPPRKSTTPGKHTERQHRRTRVGGFEDSHLRPQGAQCRTQSTRRRRQCISSGEPSPSQDISYQQEHDHPQQRKAWMECIPYLLPAPKTLSSGLNTRGSIFPSLRNLSGLKVSGSG